MEPVKNGTRSWQPSVRIVAAYVAFLTLWILGSDAVVAAIASDAGEVTRYQTLKGIFFVIVSAGLLYLLVHRTIESIGRSQLAAAESEGPLALALSQLPANIWLTDKEMRITSIRGNRNPKRPADREELIGKTIGETIGSDDPDIPSIKAHREALAGKQGRYIQAFGELMFDSSVGPLRNEGGEVIGCLGFALDVTDRLSADAERQAAVERLERLNEEREILLRHLVRAEEEERKRIAGGIHDDSIQVMTSAGMALDLLTTRLVEGEERELAMRARSLVTDAIGRLRSLVFQLRPVELEETGLAPAIRLLLKKSSIEVGFEFSLVDESSEPLASDKIHVLYQVVQETIANVRKHSGAKHVDVRLADANGGMMVAVRDDGRGFDPSMDRGTHHFGLTDMRERAHAIGGACSVTTSPGTGTLVEIWIPARDPGQEPLPTQTGGGSGSHPAAVG